MAKDFNQELAKAFVVENQLFVMNSNPTDIRQTCNTIQDFQDMAALGLELRYDGMVTYELNTKLWKGCIKNIDGTFKWIELNPNDAINPNDYALKNHAHENYIPKISATMPVDGEVWIDIS